MPRLAAGALALAAVAAAPSPARLPVHRDAPAMEEAVLDATRAFLHADTTAARGALDRIEKSCRRLSRDEAAAWTQEVVNEDIAMHAALDRARELTSRGEIDDAVASLVWVERTCRTCHALRPTTTSPAGSESPSRPNGSIP
ncbi:MAG TPA: hypothetical protein VFB67_01005 [Candidatus Polarisedimenticolaceae bacterium]|nr:hypothetical protein [Candidatus Polarisedimenticolaceae bacterium]